MSGRRFEFDGTIAEEGGQQFVNGRGAYGQGFTRVHRPEPHGFASQPIKGSKGLILSPNAQSDEAYVFGGEHPEKRPTGLPAGATALYDASGNIMKVLTTDGISIDVAGTAFTVSKGGVSFVISAGGVAITGGTVTHNGKDIGSTHVHGGVLTGGANTGAPA